MVRRMGCLQSTIKMPSESEQAVRIHNIARKQQSLAPLQWSSNLASQAESWSKKLAKTGKMQHSDTGGENLYWSSGDAQFAAAVNYWLDERGAYNGEKVGEGNFEEWGHFCMYPVNSIPWSPFAFLDGHR